MIISIGLRVPIELAGGGVLNPFMHFIARFILMFLAGATQIALLPVFAAEPGLPDTFEIGAIDRYLAAKMKAPGKAGLSVAIARDGKVVFAKGYGKRSLSDGRPVETNTLFAIGSVTKQFTCACVLLLAEDGKLSVNDPVAKYFPNLTRANDITLLDLMNHVSGYPDYYPLDFVDRRMLKPVAEDDLLREYAGGKLDFEPGTKYSYSNTGYVLLGRVVEKASGQPFGEFLQQRILKPLGLNHTSYEPGLGDPRLATGYATFALSDPEAVAPEAKGWIGAAGGIFSTPADLVKWNLALISGQVLKPASYELMTRERMLADGRQSDYACGLSVRVQGGWKVLAHTGAVSGFYAWSATIPGSRSSVVLLCNLEGGLGPLPGEMLGLLVKVPASVPEIKGLSAAEAAKALVAQIQSGRVNRRQLSGEFNHFLTDQKISDAASRLKRFGESVEATVLSRYERGGMEVTTTRLMFKEGELRALMYRKPDGIVEQFFVSRE